MGFFEEQLGFDPSRFLIDIPSYLVDHPIPDVDADPSNFTKEELAKLPGMDWLHSVECNLFTPSSDDPLDQLDQLKEFKNHLEKEAIFLEHEFCPQAFPEDYREPVIAIDTETTGLDTRVRYDYEGNLILDLKLVGLCLAVSDSVGYYLPVLHTGSDGVPNWSMEAIIEFIDWLHEDFTVVYHYGQYDRELLALNGVTKFRPWPYFFDTILLDFFADVNNKVHGLKQVSEKLLGRKMIKIEQLFEDLGAVEKIKAKDKPVINFNRLSASVANVYACSDAINTFGIFKYYASQPQELNIFFNQPIPLTVDHKNIDVLRNLYRNGLPINLDYCLYAIRDLSLRIETLEEAIYEVAGRKFEIGSPQQLSLILFEEFNIPPLKSMSRGKPTKKHPQGLYSTKEENLDKLHKKYSEYKILNYIVTYRKLNVALTRLFFKMIQNSYVDSLLPFTKVKLGFSQTVIPTGRLSSEASSKGAERVQSIEHKNGKMSYIYKKGGWSCGFNCQGVNNPFFRLKSAKRMKKLPKSVGIDLNNPYPTFVTEKIVKQLTGKDK